MVLLTGVAGMCAGAFAMAAGEYVSVRSQRELFEYQIGLERDELDAVPGSRSAGAGADLRRQGAAAARKRTRLAQQIVADPEHALDTLAREELGLNPDELGSPWGAAISSFLSFAAGALLPLVPFIVATGPRALPIAIGVTGVALFASARCFRSSPAATRSSRARACSRSARSPAASPSVVGRLAGVTLG